MRADVITPFSICKEHNDDVDDVYCSDNGAAPIAAILATNRLAVTAATTVITLFLVLNLTIFLIIVWLNC